MPFKSKAQSRYFHYLESKGKMPKKTVQEFDDTTAYDHLPEYAHEGGMVAELEHGEKKPMHKNQAPAHLAYGGMVDDEYDNFDYIKGNEEEYDSSGEPHTEYELEDKHPMEYMAYGGKAKKMSKGGMAMRSHFVKALKRGR